MPPAWATRASPATRLPRWASAARDCALKRPAGRADRPCAAKRQRRLQRPWAEDSLEPVLQQAGLPRWWIQLCLEAVPKALALPVAWGLEVFSGKGELSRAFCDVLGDFRTFEFNNDPAQDILATDGVVFMLSMLLSTCQNGLLWLGTPCKSWVVLSRSFTQRSLLQPQGPAGGTERQRSYLDEHNTIAVISAMCIRTAAALNIHY
eukprot:10496796-Lingulodinium_polyedra.AAC.1